MEHNCSGIASPQGGDSGLPAADDRRRLGDSAAAAVAALEDLLTACAATGSAGFPADTKGACHLQLPEHWSAPHTVTGAALRQLSQVGIPSFSSLHTLQSTRRREVIVTDEQRRSLYMPSRMHGQQSHQVHECSSMLVPEQAGCQYLRQHNAAATAAELGAVISAMLEV